MSLSQLWNFDISIYTDMNIPSCIVTLVFWITLKNIFSIGCDVFLILRLLIYVKDEFES